MKKENSNLIGNHQNQANRQEALKQLDKITIERAESGWIWVNKRQTSKQIPPHKLENHIADGWKRISK